MIFALAIVLMIVVTVIVLYCDIMGLLSGKHRSSHDLIQHGEAPPQGGPPDE